MLYLILKIFLISLFFYQNFKKKKSKFQSFTHSEIIVKICKVVPLSIDNTNENIL